MLQRPITRAATNPHMRSMKIEATTSSASRPERHVLKARIASAPTVIGRSMPQTVAVPVMGRIAAGVPVEAIQTRLSTIEVPPELLSKGEHYALEVKGDSMIDAGILEGDTIIVRKCEDASNGDIVVALVDEEEATLKRLRRRGDSIALEAANPAYETRIFGPDRVRVQGRLVGLIRRY